MGLLTGAIAGAVGGAANAVGAQATQDIAQGQKIDLIHEQANAEQMKQQAVLSFQAQLANTERERLAARTNAAAQPLLDKAVIDNANRDAGYDPTNPKDTADVGFVKSLDDLTPEEKQAYAPTVQQQEAARVSAGMQAGDIAPKEIAPLMVNQAVAQMRMQGLEDRLTMWQQIAGDRNRTAEERVQAANMLGMARVELERARAGNSGDRVSSADVYKTAQALGQEVQYHAREMDSLRKELDNMGTKDPGRADIIQQIKTHQDAANEAINTRRTLMSSLGGKVSLPLGGGSGGAPGGLHTNYGGGSDITPDSGGGLPKGWSVQIGNN